MEELCCFDQALQENILTLHEQHTEYIQVEDRLPYPYSLSNYMWGALVPENFKTIITSEVNGKSNPREHIVSINTHMEIIGASDSLNACFCPRLLRRWPSCGL